MRIVVLMLALTIGVSTPAQAQSERDGNWWREQSDTSRTFYLVGLLDGAQRLTISLIGHDSLDASNIETLARTAKIVGDSVPSATVGQIKDGFDDIYKDFRNRRIQVPYIAIVVFRQIRGVPEAEIAALLEQLRAGAQYAPQR